MTGPVYEKLSSPMESLRRHHDQPPHFDWPDTFLECQASANRNKSSSRRLHLATDHMMLYNVDSRISSKTPCWWQLGNGSCRNSQLEKTIHEKWASFENTIKKPEETNKTEIKARSVHPLNPAIVAMRWLLTSLLFSHRSNCQWPILIHCNDFCQRRYLILL